jgi:hypothetical protein
MPSTGNSPEDRLEKISVVGAEDEKAFQLVLSWIRGESGRVSELLPTRFATVDEAERFAHDSYGMETEPIAILGSLREER